MSNKIFCATDFDNLNLSKCDHSVVYIFLKSINSETLGRRVSISIHQRDQGHFDKAMLSLSTANRDHVLAIREIQAIFDKLACRGKTEVIFEKYRQIFPFQIGLTNGEEVLSLLEKIKLMYGNHQSISNNLYKDEADLSVLTDELSFYNERMHDQITEKELDSLTAQTSDLANKIFSTKKQLIDDIACFVSRVDHLNDHEDALTLTRNIYLLLTSSIATMDAKLVTI